MIALCAGSAGLGSRPTRAGSDSRDRFRANSSNLVTIASTNGTRRALLPPDDYLAANAIVGSFSHRTSPTATKRSSDLLAAGDPLAAKAIVDRSALRKIASATTPPSAADRAACTRRGSPPGQVAGV